MMRTEDRPRVALYVRVSTDEQGRSGYSVSDQRRALVEHAEREGWRVVDTAVDDGYSGGDPHRPGLRRVMDLASSGAIDAVLATKRDRFFRSRLYRLLTEQDLTEMGVRMVALNDTGNRLADGFQDDFAEYEREQIRERTMKGLSQKVRSGKVIRSNWHPYGFRFSEDGDSLVVHDAEMAVLRRLFQGLAEGRTGGSITREFEVEGIPSPSGLPRWNQRTITNLLHSDLYRPVTAEEAAQRVVPAVAASLDPETPYGLWAYGTRETRRWREWDSEKGAFVTRHGAKPRPKEEHLMVPVDLSGTGLERATVDAAREQAKDRSRKPSTAGGRYWVLKGVLRCAECGASIPPHTVKRYRKDGSPGKPGLYYQCRSKYNDSPKTCTNTTSHPAEALEATVWDAVHELLRNPERAQKAYEEELERRRKGQAVDPEKEAKMLSARLQAIETERMGYQRLAARGSMSDGELDAALAGLKIQKDEMEEALAEVRGRRDDEEELSQLINTIWGRYGQIREDELRYLDPEDKRRVLRGAKVRAEIDREGRVKIAGMLDLDIAELLPVDGLYRVDPDRPEPPPFKGVVETGNARWNASA